MEYHFILTVDFIKTNLKASTYTGVFKPINCKPRPTTREKVFEIIYGNLIENIARETGIDPRKTENMPVVIFFSLEPNAL